MEEDEVRHLRQQLTMLVKEAQYNQTKLLRFQALELRLLALTELTTMVETILTESRVTFELETVTLALWDPDHEYRRTLLGNHSPLIDEGHLILFEEQQPLFDAFTVAGRHPLLSPFEFRRHATFFPRTTPQTKPCSTAMIPLIRQGELVGSLNLGSHALDRYQQGQGTVFLEHFGAIVATCLENALNHQRLLHVSLSDTLTGANNRRFFDQRLPEEVARALRHTQPLTVMFLDLDHFKQVNDNYGHQSGDEVLREAAGIFKAQLRHGDTLARYGGEEFVVLLPVTDNDHGMQIAERIRHGIEQYRFTGSDEQPIRVTVSIGLATLDRQETKESIDSLAQRLLAEADTAVYEAKEGGRNRVTNRHSLRHEQVRLQECVSG